MSPTPDPTGPDQEQTADGGVWESYDATVYVYDEATDTTSPDAPDTWAWRLVALAPTADADRVDARSHGGRLVAEHVWDHTAGTVTYRWLDPDAVGSSTRPMTDDERAQVDRERADAQVAALRVEVGPELSSAEVDASLAALTEDMIAQRVGGEVMLGLLFKVMGIDGDAQPQVDARAAVRAEIAGGKLVGQQRLAEAYDDPAVRRPVLTDRVRQAREATRGPQ